jgi:RNA polymerase-binding transcription factor DksA
MDTTKNYRQANAEITPASARRFPIESRQNPEPLSDWRPGKAAPRKHRGKKLDAFLRTQRENLLELRAALVESMNGIARETRLEKADSSAFSNHSADAASDACDRDFVLSLLSQGTDALQQIDEALARIAMGTYGTCEMSGRPIPVSRLKAIPFARFTVECQARMEQGRALRVAQTLPSPFSVADEEEPERFRIDQLHSLLP